MDKYIFTGEDLCEDVSMNALADYSDPADADEWDESVDQLVELNESIEIEAMSLMTRAIVQSSSTQAGLTLAIESGSIPLPLSLRGAHSAGLSTQSDLGASMKGNRICSRSPQCLRRNPMSSWASPLQM